MTTQGTANVPPVGSLIAGKYRVERIVGQGGMGVVVAATHIALEETVAIKLMFEDDLSDRGAIERFVREARASVKLKHNEHVARVTDVDNLPNGLPYMVMELLQGQDLDKLLKARGVLPIHDACSYVVQACNALVAAHELGIIHRDLKPQNLFLTHRQDGSPCIKLLDFGISKHVLLSDSPANDLTKPTEVLGSALYMSPEQLRSSRDVVPQSDIWSLGVVLYKLLTGRVPFQGQSRTEIWMALLDENRPAPPPAQYRADIPPELEAIMLKCLEKDVTRRTSSARELMAALAPFTVPGQTTASDEMDAATTLPMVRRAKPVGLGGTLPMLPKANELLAADQGAHFKTQPLDPRTLQAALNGYLPPRPIPRPAPPSAPPDEKVTTSNDATPRMAPQELVGTVYRLSLKDAAHEIPPPIAKTPPNHDPPARPREFMKTPPLTLVAACLIALIVLVVVVQLR